MLNIRGKEGWWLRGKNKIKLQWENIEKGERRKLHKKTLKALQTIY